MIRAGTALCRAIGSSQMPLGGGSPAIRTANILEILVIRSLLETVEASSLGLRSHKQDDWRRVTSRPAQGTTASREGTGRS